MPRWRSQFCLAAMLVWTTGAGAADSDVQLWPVVTLHHGLTERWGAHLQLRGRFDEDVSHAKDLLVRPFASWRALDSLTVDLGYDYIHAFQADTEHRVWEAAEHRAQWGDLAVKNRIRLGHRFPEGVDRAVHRLRYRLRAMFPLGDTGWHGAISDEVFANLNDRGEGPVSGFEQNRVRAGVALRPRGRVRAELGYEWQYAERRSRSAVHRHVFFVELSIDTGSREGGPKSPP